MLSYILKYDLDVTKNLFSVSKNKRDPLIKASLKNDIQLWLEEQNIVDTFVTIEDMSPSRHKHLTFRAVGIHNNYNSVIKGNLWLNKIIVQMKYHDGSYPNFTEIFDGWYVRTHKVTTDARFLAPFQNTFLEFITELDEYLKH